MLARSILPVLLFAATTLAAQTPAQTPAPAPPLPPPIAHAHEPLHQLTLNVVATDKSGKPIAGLEQADFTLLDNKHPVAITSFHAITPSNPPQPPVQILLVIDEVNARFTDVAFQRDSVKKYLARNEGQLTHPTSIIFFSDSGTEVLEGKSSNGHDLIAALDQHITALRTIRRDQGIYGAEDRLELSLRTLGLIAAREADIPGRKIVIWISPGWPYLSGPNINLSNREQQSLFHTVIGLSALLRQANITLSSVDPVGANASVLRSTYYDNFLKGVTKARDVEGGDLALQVLASHTGGRVLNGSNDSTGEMVAAASDADTYYVLTLSPTPAEHPDDYHNLQIKIDRPGLTLRTLSGYYNEP